MTDDLVHGASIRPLGVVAADDRGGLQNPGASGPDGASSGPTFARLVDVAPREAWALEAHAFTPWLADNLDRLSEAVGIPLELTGREVGVGRYAADILASSPADGAVVLIENQLEASDHKHLGQILTYLAGLEAQVVIWCAPQFREEHLSALRWLNQHTDDRFAFFAIKLRVVRIADSPLAPLFEVLEKPNSWDKSLQKTARAAAEPSAQVSRAKAFWARYAEADPRVTNDPAVGKGVARWRAIGNTGVVASRWFGKDRAGIFLRGSRGVDYAEMAARLSPYAAELEKALGAFAGSDRFLYSKEGPVLADDPASWDAAIDWLITETERYARVVTDIVPEDPA